LQGKQRILFVCSSLGGGGAERVAVLLLEYLDRDRFEPGLVLFQEWRDYDMPRDVPVICLQKRGWYDFLKLIWRLSRVYKNWKPDVVLSFLSHVNIIAVLAQKLSHAKFRLLLSEHALQDVSLSNAKTPLSLLFSKWMPRWLYPCADKVICVSQGVAESVQHQYKTPIEEIRVIYNPVDLKHISTLAQEGVEHPWFAPKTTPIIISVGRLNVQKGYPYLLKAFAHVAAKLPCRLVILGKGKEEQALKALAKQLSIEGKVAFLGFQENPFKYMAHSDLFVLASLREAFGMVITEAMACGIPVISTNCPSGPAEIITDGVNGLLVPIANELALASAMLQVLTDRQLATNLAQAGRERARDFAVGKIVKEYEEILR